MAVNIVFTTDDQDFGQCPVQVEGMVNDIPFYFRARGNRWSMNIGGDDILVRPDWSYEESYGTMPFEAGYISVDEAKAFIRHSARLFAWSTSNAKINDEQSMHAPQRGSLDDDVRGP